MMAYNDLLDNFKILLAPELYEAVVYYCSERSQMTSILQDWVQELGLRHQGVLLTAVRGCDTAPKDDPSKLFVRCYRCITLNDFCGNNKTSRSFIEYVNNKKLIQRFEGFRKNLDHYPHHYIMHLIHAIEIVGYKHPDSIIANQWFDFYRILCKGLHLNMESEQQLDDRLYASEEIFLKQ